MIETIPSVQQVALRARLAQAAITLAKREAEKAVKQALKGRGLKPQYHPEARDRHHREGLPRGASRADRRGKADH